MSHLTGAGRVWLWAGVAAVVVVGMALTLFKVPPVNVPMEPASAAPAAPTPRVELAWNGDALLKEETALRDPTPLFLPTRWNASEDALAMNAPREPGGSFQDYAPSLSFAAAELQLELPAPVVVPERPADVFALRKSSPPLVGFGQKDDMVAPLTARAGFIEVSSAKNGQIMIRQPLLEGGPGEEGLWQPLEFLVAIDPAGIVRPPVLTESSRVPTVDAYFEEYLVKTLKIGERLDPGFYRVSIGP